MDLYGSRLWTTGTAHVVANGYGVARRVKGGAEWSFRRFDVAALKRGQEPPAVTSVAVLDRDGDSVLLERGGWYLADFKAQAETAPRPLPWADVIAAVGLDDGRLLVARGLESPDGMRRARLQLATLRNGLLQTTSDVALPKARRIEWPDAAIWGDESAPWPEDDEDAGAPFEPDQIGVGIAYSGRTSWNEVRLHAGEHGVTVTANYSGMVLVLDPKTLGVRFAVRVPTQDEAEIHATATPAGVLVTVIVERRHSCMLHIAPDAKILGFRAKLDGEPAFGVDAVARLDAAHVWVTNRLTGSENFALTLPDLKEQALDLDDAHQGLLAVSDPKAGPQLVALGAPGEKPALALVSWTPKGGVKLEPVDYPELKPPPFKAPVSVTALPPHLSGLGGALRPKDGPPVLTLATAAPVAVWSAAAGKASSLPLVVANGGGPSAGGHYLELSGPAVTEGLLEGATLKLQDVAVAFEPKGSTWRAEAPSWIVAAAGVSIIAPATRSATVPIVVEVLGSRAGKALLTVRVGRLAEKGTKGSALIGKPIEVRAGDVST